MPLADRFRSADIRVTRWMARHGVAFLRVSLGVVFLWFGLLKFFPGLSPAQDLLKNLVLVSAAVVIGATVRGGTLVADPHPRE